MSEAMLWPYGKCVECANKSDCVDSHAQIIACMSNGYPDYKPQTNADRIRSMSDEELAKYLAWLEDTEACYEWELYGDKDRINEWHEWLKEEFDNGK